jgi:hypothetical protein
MKGEADRAVDAVADVTAASLGVAAMQSFICRQLAGSSGSPRPSSPRRFRREEATFTTYRPPPTCAGGFILSSACSSSETSVPDPPRTFVVRSSFLGVGLPSSRHQPAASLRRASLRLDALPSSTFHTSSTVCSATCLVGLFHPTTTSRVFPSGVFPPTQPERLIDVPCPLAVSANLLPTHCCVSATSRRPASRALIRAGIRCRCASV